MSIPELCFIVMSLWGTWHSYDPAAVEVRWTKARLDGYCGLYLDAADDEARERMRPYLATTKDVLYDEQDYMLAQILKLPAVTFSIDGLDNLEKLED